MRSPSPTPSRRDAPPTGTFAGDLWIKGEESGNMQVVRELRTDCDQDVTLLKVDQAGPANASCHNGYKSCFYRRLTGLQDPAFRLETMSKPLLEPALSTGKSRRQGRDRPLGYASVRISRIGPFGYL